MAETEYVLRTEHLGISFGGLKAVQDVNLGIRKGEIYGLIVTERRGKNHGF